MTLTLTGPLARAARVLVQLSRTDVARKAGLEKAALAAFEEGRDSLPRAARDALRAALEAGGAVFLPEDGAGGLGVRLKFNSKDVRAIARLESEGGPVGEDDV